MTATLFVPLNDELPEHPGYREDRLVPYRTDLPCYHWLAVEPVVTEATHDRQEVRHVAA